jgi:hypothetical protein
MKSVYRAVRTGSLKKHSAILLYQVMGKQYTGHVATMGRIKCMWGVVGKPEGNLEGLGAYGKIILKGT